VSTVGTQDELRETFFQSTCYHAIPGGLKKLEYLFSVLIRMRQVSPRMKVLDVGCGNGSIALAVASLGYDVLGVDINESSVQYARNVNRYPNARFEVVPGSCFNLSQSFDLIICSEVLEHLDTPGPLVATMSRHLKESGQLLITVPNGYGPREVLGRTETLLRERLGLGRLIDHVRGGVKMMDAAAKCAVHTSNPDQDHVQKFTIRQLKALIEKAGMRIVETVNSIFVFSIIFRTKSGIVDVFDGRLADCLPRSMASGWYLLCRKRAMT
jgi:SAM-dependent methyltransferase